MERDIASAITSSRMREKAKAMAELDIRARELVFSLAELTGAAERIKGKHAPAAAQHPNPAVPSDTWSARGREPAWFGAAIAAGTKPDDLAAK